MAFATGTAIALGVSTLLAGGVARNQQMKAKSEATTAMRNANKANDDYLEQKQEARNANQAPDSNALNRAKNRAKQNAIANLQKRSGRESTFLSNGLGG